MNIYYAMPEAMFSMKSLFAAQSSDLLYNILKVLYSIIMFGLILLVTYYVTKYIAKKGVVRSKNKNLKIVEALSLGMDKSIYLISIGEQYMLVASAQKSLTLLSRVDADLLYLDEAKDIGDNNSETFDSYLNSFNQRIKKDFLTKTMKQKLQKLDSVVRGKKSDE